MTREEAKTVWPMVKAYSEGAEIQYKLHDPRDTWQTSEEPRFDTRCWCYRIKPESKLRPWKRSEVPFGKLIRTRDSDVWHVIVALHSDHLKAGHAWSGDLRFCFDSCEWSEDNGKTWKPCGVEETI